MASKLKPGDVITHAAGGSKVSYTIQRWINTGMFATSFEATDSSGRKVFFKQYKSPVPRTSWFNDYVAYCQRINGKLQSPELQPHSLSAIEIFIGCDCDGLQNLYQVFEFISEGLSLQSAIEGGKMPGVERVIAATLFLSALKKLHAADIVHTDLKPDNVYMIDNPAAKLKFRPLVIDFDFSIDARIKAPWDGNAGYVGTKGYMSPEHLNGEVPTKASDVYTAALIIYDLLGSKDPRVGPGESLFTGPVPKLVPRSDVVLRGDLIDLLARALSSNQYDRPTAEELHVAFMAPALPAPVVPARTPVVKPSPAPSPAATPAPSPAAKVEAPVAAVRQRLVLEGSGGSFSGNVTTEVSRRLLRRVIDIDASFPSGVLFVLDKTSDGWYIKDINASAAITHQGRTAVSGAKLNAGDVITVCGRQLSVKIG